MRLFKKLRAKLDYLDPQQINQVEEAYHLALKAHQGQLRMTGEPYIIHPVAVAGMLAEFKMDVETLMAALLHDVIEDTSVKKEDIAKQFGQIVANLVDGVSKLTQIEFGSRIEAQAENFRKMVWAMADDIRVIIIKLADRLHNMRTLGPLAPQKSRRIARETLEIFAPIARRLGMHEFSIELEELGFKSLHPLRNKILKKAVISARGERKKILALIEKALHEALRKSGITCAISGREKHLYSIYRKMRVKHIPFNEIMDVYAFRIIVNEVDTCYRVLGIVHQLFKPMPGRFKDYIALPKANGYQSLHTILFGPYGLPTEIQIRTTEMDRTSTSGIAAHWLYKSGNVEIGVQAQVRAQQWVKNLLELQQQAVNPIEFIENVKTDLFPDEVFVFTPRGDILNLPVGATPIDFAYAVHTDIGDHCEGVKVNRQMAPLSSSLRNGQTIEIITSSDARPNPAWLDFVVTSKARNGIRHFLKSQRRNESTALGKQLLKKALLQYGLHFRKLPALIIETVLKEIHLESIDDLLEQIGLGNRVAALVAEQVALLMQITESDIKSTVDVTADVKETAEVVKPLVVKGTEGLVVTFSECCFPIPGDPIVGVIEPGKGILVHMEHCPELAKFRLQPGHLIALRWSKKIEADFIALVRVQVLNTTGVLAALTNAISSLGVNIEDLQIDKPAENYYMLIFKVKVKNREHLAQILKSIRKVPQVVRVMAR